VECSQQRGLAPSVIFLLAHGPEIDSTWFVKAVLLVFGQPELNRLETINVNFDTLDAEYEALCADFSGALV
jgi:hypothetical protein